MFPGRRFGSFAVVYGPDDEALVRYEAVRAGRIMPVYFVLSQSESAALADVQVHPLLTPPVHACLIPLQLGQPRA